MDEFKVTPGDWRPGRLPGTVVADCEADDLNSDATTRAYGGELIAESIGNPADVPLIAAAPKMLAALLLRREYDSLPADRGGEHGPKGKARRRWLDAEDAAIASATGRDAGR